MSSSSSLLWFASLVKWISQEGGQVHPDLEIRGTGGSDRGIFAKSTIRCGETLIRLPLRLAIQGGADASTNVNHDEETTTTKATSSAHESPWLRCLVALYRARSDSSSFYKPYLDSLPQNYETLFAWTDEQISNYLAGTTIGNMTSMERKHKFLQARYITSVRPILEKEGLVPRLAPKVKPSPEELDTIRDACLCISSRAFHSSPEMARPFTENAAYSDDGTLSCSCGPFLLPLIDLVNHDSGPRKCTTLTRNGNTFYMTAERDIEADAEVLHSYGNQLSAEQFLQTFGFVPRELVQAVCGESSLTIGWSQSTNTASTCLTPAALSKTCVLEACRKVAASEYAAQLRQQMQDRGMDDEVWDVIPQDMETRDTSIISKDLLVQSNAPVLSDELITLCTLLLVPKDAYDSMVSSGLSLLDRSVLDDYYLGMLICQTILTVIGSKRRTYTPLTTANEVNDTNIAEWDDRAYLSALLDQDDDSDRNMNECTRRRRAVYGLTVRLEEQQGLQALESVVRHIMACLERGDSISDDENGSVVRTAEVELQNTSTKRPKTDMNE